MTENAIADLPTEGDTSEGRFKIAAVQGLLLAGELMAMIWLLDRVVSADWVEAACLSQFILAMVVASASIYCAAARRRKLYKPICHLQNLLPEIRAGRVPMEDLALVTGQLAPIALQFLEVFRELRANKSEMNNEIRQRIANKTEALERKIGTLKHQATRDVLTGLLNRRALNEHLAQAIERCVKENRPICVLMIDIDNFKPLNDTLGHAAGDDFLRSLGQLLRSTLRENDVAFRCGGDEFVVVLEGSDTAGTAAFSKRLNSLVDGLVKTLKVPLLPRLSIGSAGLNEVSEHSADAILEEADKRLYAAKVERKRSAPAVLGNPRNAGLLQRIGGR